MAGEQARSSGGFKTAFRPSVALLRILNELKNDDNKRSLSRSWGWGEVWTVYA